MHCDVLYLCLEDTQRRIKDRLFDLTNDPPRSFHLSVTCGLIGNGLEEEIINFFGGLPEDKAGNYRHASKRCGIPKAAPGNGNVRQRLRRHFSIKRIADEHDISIILVHHLRKLKDGDDPFNEVSGLLPASPERRTPIMCLSANEAAGMPPFLPAGGMWNIRS